MSDETKYAVQIRVKHPSDSSKEAAEKLEKWLTQLFDQYAYVLVIESEVYDY